MTDDDDIRAAAERLLNEHDIDHTLYCTGSLPDLQADLVTVARAVLALTDECEALRTILRISEERIRIATKFLEWLAAQRGQDMRYPGEHATLADDALTQMSVVDAEQEHGQ